MDYDRLRGSLLADITKLDFMAADLGLYLNTHPNDGAAADVYNKIAARSRDVKEEFEKQFGPITGFRCENRGNGWQWAENPWPWQKNFNSHICESLNEEKTNVGL